MTTNAQLRERLDAAHRVLGYKISLAHHDIVTARNAIRRHPECRLFPRDLERAVEVHHRAKRLGWLSAEDAATVRAHAAEFIRADLATARTVRPRAHRAHRAAATLALAA